MVKLWDARRAVGSLAISVCIIAIVGLHKEIIDGWAESFYWSLFGAVVCTVGIIGFIKTIFLVWAWMHRKPNAERGKAPWSAARLAIEEEKRYREVCSQEMRQQMKKGMDKHFQDWAARLKAEKPND